MSTEIRLAEGPLEVRATVDDDRKVNVTLRHDDKDESDRMYVSLAGSPDEIRRTLASILAVVNAVARSIDELTAADAEAVRS